MTGVGGADIGSWEVKWDAIGGASGGGVHGRECVGEGVARDPEVAVGVVDLESGKWWEERGGCGRGSTRDMGTGQGVEDD